MNRRAGQHKSWSHGAWFGGLLLFCSLVLWAQERPVGRVKNFAVPDYDAQNRRKAVLYGEEATSGTNGLWNIHRLKIESYAGQTNPAWIVEAPACLYHDPTRRAWSDGPLTASSTDGQLTVTGRGFDWRQTEQRLVISNQVRTVLRPVKPQPGDTAAPRPGLARHDLELTAQTLVFEGQRSAAHYLGEVRVRELLPPGATNPPVTLDCGELIIFLSTNRGGVEIIEARQQVRFTQGPARLQGEQARYTASNDVMTVERAAQWETEQAEGQAERLVYDRSHGEVWAGGQARARLREAAGRSLATNGPAGGVLELGAPALHVTLPSSNRPLTTLAATGLVTVSRGDWQAGGESLYFSGTATSGVARIRGNPWWRSEAAEGTAAELWYDRQSHLFSGRGRGQVKLRRPGAGKTEAVMTLQAEEYDLAEEEAVFRGQVVAEEAQWHMQGATLRLRQAPRSRQWRTIEWGDGVEAEQRLEPGATTVPWRLQCAALTVEMSADGQRPARLLARGNIRLEPARPAGAATNATLWKLQCERLLLGLNEKQQVESAVAEQRVYLETVPPDAQTPAWALTGERLTLKMAAGRTNQVEHLRVEQQVTLRQVGGVSARGGVWHLAGQRADLRFDSATGQAVEAEADGGVHAVQLHSNLTQVVWTLMADTARLALGPGNRVERLQARRTVRVEQGHTTNAPPWQMQSEQVDMTFSPSNTVQILEAREQVLITQGASRATGALGLYRGSTEEFELRGQPRLLLVDDRAARTNGPPRRLEIEGAEVLVWDRVGQTFRGRGPYRIRPTGPLSLPRRP